MQLSLVAWLVRIGDSENEVAGYRHVHGGEAFPTLSRNPGHHLDCYSIADVGRK
jgi:hypothetical protein